MWVIFISQTTLVKPRGYLPRNNSHLGVNHHGDSMAIAMGERASYLLQLCLKILYLKCSMIIIFPTQNLTIIIFPYRFMLFFWYLYPLFSDKATYTRMGQSWDSEDHRCLSISSIDMHQASIKIGVLFFWPQLPYGGRCDDNLKQYLVGHLTVFSYMEVSKVMAIHPIQLHSSHGDDYHLGAWNQVGDLGI